MINIFSVALNPKISNPGFGTLTVVVSTFLKIIYLKTQIEFSD